MATQVSQSANGGVRHDWTRAEIGEIYRLPLLELVFRAQQVHRAHHPPNRVQTCWLVSIKTGACPEDCGYCPQSAHYKTGVARQDLMAPDEVIGPATRAKASGERRFCMGPRWREGA